MDLVVEEPCSSVQRSSVIPEGGHLRYPVQQDDLSRAQTIIDKMQSSRRVEHIFKEVGEARKQSAILPASKPSKLLVIYTDFEPDDILAVAQIVEWKRELGELECQPIIIFWVDFVSKDHGTVFEKKLLMANLMLGITDPIILTHGGGKGDNKRHPKAKDVGACHEQALSSLCASLVGFHGDCIDLHIMAPGHGNLGAIVGELQRSNSWPLKAEWRVCIYSGSFNTRGMKDADLEALEEVCKHCKFPLIDLSSFVFFGGKPCHPMTASLGTFSSPTFAAELTLKAPLLASVMVLFDREFNVGLIHPDNTGLFRGNELNESERQRFLLIKQVFLKEGVNEYARSLKADSEIFGKVVGYKKTTIAAFASDACDSPLCDQLLFLYSWLSHEKPSWLTNEEIGKWCLDRKTGFTSIDQAASDGIRAMQPALRYPQDEAMLKVMQGILQEYVFRHLDSFAILASDA